jgi:hypothetical protein
MRAATCILPAVGGCARARVALIYEPIGRGNFCVCAVLRDGGGGRVHLTGTDSTDSNVRWSRSGPGNQCQCGREQESFVHGWVVVWEDVVGIQSKLAGSVCWSNSRNISLYFILGFHSRSDVSRRAWDVSFSRIVPRKLAIGWSYSDMGRSHVRRE